MHIVMQCTIVCTWYNTKLLMIELQSVFGAEKVFCLTKVCTISNNTTSTLCAIHYNLHIVAKTLLIVIKPGLSKCKYLLGMDCLQLFTVHVHSLLIVNIFLHPLKTIPGVGHGQLSTL